MNAYSVTCPQCGAQLTVDSERRMMFCEYCGSKILLSDPNLRRIEIKKESVNKNITIDYGIIAIIIAAVIGMIVLGVMYLSY